MKLCFQKTPKIYKKFNFWFIAGPFLFLMNNLAHAGPSFYADAGGSVLKIKNPAPFFGSDNGSSNWGFGFNYGIFTKFTNGDPAAEIQFGIQNRYSSASSSDNSSTYAFLAPYPVIRLQLSRIYLSGGYTPFVWRSVTSGSSAGGVSHVAGAKAYFGEAGILFPITPRFSFGSSATAEFVSANGSSSPNPIESVNLFMRFYFGFGDGNSRPSNEFKGWRYPLGHDLH